MNERVNNSIVSFYGVCGSSKDDPDALAGWMILVWIISFWAMLKAPFQIAVVPIVWLALGVFTVWLKANLACRRDPKTSFGKELWYGMQYPFSDGVFFSISFWPLELLLTLLGNFSYREAFQQEYFRELRENLSNYGMRNDTAYEFSVSATKRVEKEAEQIAEKVRGISENIENVPPVAIRTAALITAISIPVASPRAEPLLPTMKVGELTAQAYGWSSLSYAENAEGKVDFATMRCRLDLKKKTAGFFVDAEMVGMVKDGELKGNWLKEARLSFSAHSWQFRAGRIFLAGTYSSPAPFLLETANGPRLPFTFFGWGLQAKHVSSSGLEVVADLTGRTGLAFAEGGKFDKPEISTNVTKKLGDSFLRGNAQLSSGFGRFAFDGVIIPFDGSVLRGAIYYNSESRNGGYLFYSYRPRSWIEAHLQFDIVPRAPDRTISVAGLGFSAMKNRLKLIGDYEHRHSRSGLFGRLQFIF